jgi:PAS domain S-box-containing protein
MLTGTKSRPAKPLERDIKGMIVAIDRVMAVIEFSTDGNVLSANANFSTALGFSFEEINGRHHRMFVDPAYADSEPYRQFWDKLKRGEFIAGEFKRFAKGGREIWLQASYNPIKDSSGRVTRVVKFATDITDAKNKAIDAQGQMEAIGRSQAVIEFKLDGTIITANANFLGAIGYSLEEIRGRHHQMFVENAYANSAEYKQFWEPCGEESSRRPSTSASGRVASRSGSRRLTTRSRMPTACPQKSSSMQPTLPRKSSGGYVMKDCPSRSNVISRVPLAAFALSHSKPVK